MAAYGVLGLVIAYLLGSVSGAYIVTRFVFRKDIRKLGSGNTGVRNVYTQLGFKAAFPVAVIDVGKGALAILISHRLAGLPSMRVLSAPELFVLAAGLAVVAGHIWPVYLRFKGGNGLSPTIGVLAILMTWELVIGLGLAVVLMVVTRNPILSLNFGLLTLPFFAWFSGDPRQNVIFLVLLALMLILHFLPTARAALAEAGGKDKLLADLLRANKPVGKPKRAKKRKKSAR